MLQLLARNMFGEILCPVHINWLLSARVETGCIV